MKTEEDEAFDDLAKKQGSWGGGFKAKQAMAADKLQEPVLDLDGHVVGKVRKPQPAHCQCTACKNGVLHASDCAVHNGPAYPAGECDCSVAQEPDMLTIAYQSGYYDGKKAALAQPVQEAIYGMNQDDWKDVVAAISKVRDGRGIYLGCRPADVFQDWFLALGTAKVKEKNNG